MAKHDRPGGGTPSTKMSKDKTGEIPVLCVTCNKNAKEDSIECEASLEWEHQECTQISKDEYRILSDSLPNIIFFCGLCRLKVKLRSIKVLQ